MPPFLCQADGEVYRRFVDDSLGFALTWNYWFNDAVSVATDLVALQLLLQYWTDNFPGWAFSLIFLFVLVGMNIVTVRLYGEVGFCVFKIRGLSQTNALRLVRWSTG